MVSNFPTEGGRTIATPGRIEIGSHMAPRVIESISGEQIRLPDDHRFVHLQFRRFAGCPVCNLHLRSFATRHDEIVNAGVRAIVLFHSTNEELGKHASNLPFSVVADPNKILYTEFGVEASVRSLLDPRTWPAIVSGVGRSLLDIVRYKTPMPSLNPAGGRFGLPADFLIANDGRIAAFKYGAHADDQWSVEELIERVRISSTHPI